MSASVELTLDQIMAFQAVFEGNNTFYGKTVLTGKHRADGKAEVICTTESAPLLRECYKNHLEGKIGLGVCPIKQDNTVSFGAIDVDTYDGGVIELAKSIDKLGLPLCPCLSKSGGLHIYAFFAEGTTAKAAIEVLSSIKILLGLPPKTEVFPKQAKLTNKGNWINLPYFGAANSSRVLLVNGEPMPLFSQALYQFQNSVMNIKQWKAALDLPLSDAPPCLQSLYYVPVQSNRNIYLFNLATYYKAKGDKWQEEVLEANAALPNPLTEEEIEKTIFNSHNQHTYAYQCDQSPLCDRCDKAVCAKRKYGATSKDLPDINYGQMYMVTSIPPRYYWEINGQTFNFENAGTLRKYSAFQEQCADQLGFFPHSMKQDKWLDILNLALSHVQKTDERAEELSANYSLGEELKRWLFTSPWDITEDEAFMLHVSHLNLEDNTVSFLFADLMHKLNETRATTYSSVVVAEWLRHAGAVVVTQGKVTKWSIAATNIAPLEKWKVTIAEQLARRPYETNETVKLWIGDDISEEVEAIVDHARALRYRGVHKKLGYILDGEEDI